MRFALVSDIHGNLSALEAVVRDLEQRGADCVVNLGDALSGPLLPLETAEVLMATDWVHLAGNHERQLLTDLPEAMGASDAYARSQLREEHLAWCRSLPGTRPFGEDIFLCHGTPGSDLEHLLQSVEDQELRPATDEEIEERLGSTEGRVVACGHSHLPRVARTSSGRLCVNPGSVGLQAYRVEGFLPEAVATGSPEARYALVEKQGGVWNARILHVPYDAEPMARLAERNGRPTWARALRQGVC